MNGDFGVELGRYSATEIAAVEGHLEAAWNKALANEQVAATLRGEDIDIEVLKSLERMPLKVIDAAQADDRPVSNFGAIEAVAIALAANLATKAVEKAVVAVWEHYLKDVMRGLHPPPSTEDEEDSEGQ